MATRVGRREMSEQSVVPFGDRYDGRVLITVKTYPSASSKHRETSCVAGVALDPEPRWIRIYPVPFRLMKEENRFKKYDIVNLSATRPTSGDRRPESMRLISEKITSLESVPANRYWDQRKKLMGSLLGSETTCEMNNGVKQLKGQAPSLAAVRPRNPEVHVVKPEPWPPERINKNRETAAPDLFGISFKELQQPPWDVRIRYKCESDGCRGHDQKILDWEAGQAALDWSRKKGDNAAKYDLEAKWNSLVDATHDPYLYIGNLNQHPGSFCVIGIWSAIRHPNDPGPDQGAMF